MIELALSTIVSPIYLIIIDYKLCGKLSLGNAIIWWFFMLFIVLIGQSIHYIYWGLSSGNLMKPDSETVLILQLAIITSTIILTAGWIIACTIKSKS